MQQIRAGTKTAAKSWSSTIFLPKSDFPLRPDPAIRPLLLRQSTDELYSWQRQNRPATNTFTLHDGPPYANGKLHIGHALNKILKDIICRTKIARGKRVQYVPGWDCHGLPIELKALEANRGGSQDAELSHNPIKVRTIARKLAKDAVELQKSEFRSWGITGDWSHAWTTMDRKFELDQLRVFQRMVTQGLISRKNKPVYWSPSSRTALAEAELEYNEEHISHSIVVKVPIDRSTVFSVSGDRFYEDVSVPIWTTTPWTIPANMAIAFNKDLDYTIVRSSTHGILLVAAARVKYMEQLLSETLDVAEEAFPGIVLVNKLSYHSLFSQDGPVRRIISADFVTAETGTGFVHCAPGHGLEDYEALMPLIRAGDVQVQAPVDDNGCFTSDELPSPLSYLAGKNVLGDGNKAVVEALRNQGVLLATQRYKHKYPYDWRTKQPVIVRATPQWFADVSSVRQQALKAIQSVSFYPESGKARLSSFLQNRSEWCISRQRAWGLPIPAIFDEITGEAILTSNSIDHVIKMIAERGIDAWWSDAPDDPAWIAPTYREQYPRPIFRRGTDTMDVWFDSGTSWTQMDTDVADLYVEGTDQHRGWFQSSLLTRIASTGHNEELHAPYKSLITHGFTLDQHGKKMSKSLGNVISPDEIIEGTFAGQKPAGRKSLNPKLGPDILRLWVASSDFTKDVVVSPTMLANVQGILHKYRVTFKLLLGSLADFDPSRDAVLHDDLRPIDQMALWQLSKTNNTMADGFNHNYFHKAVGDFNRWINGDLSAFYIEAIKDRLYCSDATSTDRRQVQTVLYNVLREMQSMLSPLTPLLVEETWYYSPSELRREPSPCRRHFKPLAPCRFDAEFEQHWPTLRALNEAVKGLQEAARNEKKLGSSVGSYVLLQIPKDAESAPVLQKYKSTLKDMTVVSGLKINSEGAVLSVWSYEKEIKLLNGDAVKVTVSSPPNGFGKCVRCWQFTVDQSKLEGDADELCDRCRNVVDRQEERESGSSN